MLTRLAIFHGTVKPGMEAEMRAFVANRLAPLWRQFEGAAAVRVLHGLEQDPDGPPVALVLAVDYPDRAAMARAMASPARHASRDLLPDFHARFFEKVSLHHYLTQHDTPGGDSPAGCA